jgi:hypothetical protein
MPIATSLKISNGRLGKEICLIGEGRIKQTIRKEQDEQRTGQDARSRQETCIEHETQRLL